MYIINRYGYFAVTCAGDPAERRAGADEVAVRGGSVQAMDRLREAYPKLRHFPAEAEADPRFPVRMRLPRALWSRVVEQLVLDLEEDDPLPCAA